MTSARPRRLWVGGAAAMTFAALFTAACDDVSTMPPPVPDAAVDAQVIPGRPEFGDARAH